MGYSLGIDLGTTYTAAALTRDGRTEMVPLGNRAASIPSLVFLRDDGTVLAGEAAERRGLGEPARLARQFKRRVGDTAPIVLGATPYSADRLTGLLLQQVVAAATEREGERPDHVAVCHPASWGPFKVDLLRQACEQADLPGATLLTEPVAAAVHFAATDRIDVGGVVAVYDLGGGTFDAAVLRRTGDGFEPLGEPAGIERLGGIDFDEAVHAHVARSLDGALDRLDPDDPTARQALARLRQECVAAKEALSVDADTTIPVVLPNLQVDLRLTRAELEEMIRPTIGETIAALHRALANAGVGAEELQAVLLVGGSSRIPLVAEMVSSAMGRPVSVNAHPKHAIALGAAIVAARAAPGVGAAAPEPPPAAPNPPAAAPGSPGPTPEVAPAAAAPPPAEAPAGPVGSRRRWTPVAGAAAVAAVVVVVAASVGLSGSGGSAAAPTTTSDPTATTTDDGHDHVGVDTTTTAAAGCAAAEGRCATITSIRIDGDRYVAEYDVVGFEPRIVGEDPAAVPGDHHLHFFFDTTAPEHAGVNSPTPGAWELWDLRRGGGRQVFDAFTVDQRGDATRLCVAVATEAHHVSHEAAAGASCVALPDA